MKAMRAVGRTGWGWLLVFGVASALSVGCAGGGGDDGGIAFGVIAEGASGAPVYTVTGAQGHVLALERLALGFDAFSFNLSGGGTHTIATGPRALWLPLDGSRARLLDRPPLRADVEAVTLTLRPPVFSDLSDLDPGALTPEQESALLALTSAQTGPASVLLEGSFDGEPFQLALALEASVRVPLIEPLALGARSRHAFTIRLRLERWLRRPDGALRDPRAPAAVDEFGAALTDALDLFRDDDLNGGFDLGGRG